MTRQGRGVVGGLLIALALPATALADPPDVTTNAATGVGQDVATLNGSVTPNNNATNAFFQYGTSKIYGATTPPQGIVTGQGAVKVSAPIGGLAPATTYHFRVVAQYGPNNSLRFGKDRTFKTAKQPLGLTLTATPSTVHSGDSTTLSGQLTGTDAPGKQVLLQANPYPFAGFANQGNPQVVGPDGSFTFPILNVYTNTDYRVTVPDKPEVVSPIVAVRVKVRLSLTVKHRVRKGRKLTFRGRVTPVNEGAPIEIQRSFHGTWVTVARTTCKRSGAGASYYKKKLRIRRSGRYRALVTPGGAYIGDVSRAKRIRTHR